MCGDGPRPVAQPARSNAAAAKGRSQGVIPRLIRLACSFGLLTVASLLWVCPSTGAGDNYVGVYQCASLVVDGRSGRSEEHTSELQSLAYLVCRLLLEKKKNIDSTKNTQTKRTLDTHPQQHRNYPTCVNTYQTSRKSRAQRPIPKQQRLITNNPDVTPA